MFFMSWCHCTPCMLQLLFLCWCRDCSSHIGIQLSSHQFEILFVLICYSPRTGALFSSHQFVIMFMLINCFSYVLVCCFAYIGVSLFSCVGMFFFLCIGMLLCLHQYVILSCQFVIHLLCCCYSFCIGVVDPLAQVLGCCNSSCTSATYCFPSCTFLFTVVLHLLNVPIGPTFVVLLLELLLFLFSLLVWYFPPLLALCKSKLQAPNFKHQK